MDDGIRKKLERSGQSYCDDQGEPIYEGGFKLTPTLLMSGIQSWDRGEPLTPHGMANL